MSLLDIVRAVVPSAAAARGGYVEGQRERDAAEAAGRRQTLLDQMKQAMDRATVDHLDAETEGLRHPRKKLREQKVDPVSGDVFNIFEDGTVEPASTGGGTSGTSLSPSPRLTTPAAPTAPAATAPKSLLDGIRLSIGGSGTAPSQPTAPASPAPTGSLIDQMKSATGQNGQDASPSSTPRFRIGVKGPNVKDTNVVNPDNGMVEDVYLDGTRKPVRKATAAELAKATMKPRDPNAPPAEREEDALAKREKAAAELAYSAIEGSHGDIGAAEAEMNRPGQIERARALGLTRRHYNAALQRYNDRMTSKSSEAEKALADEIRKSSASPTTGGGRAGGGAGRPATAPTPAASPTKPPAWLDGVSLDEKTGAPEGLDLAAAARATATDQQKAEIAVERYQKGLATLPELLKSPYLNDAVKAVAWRKLSADSAAAPRRTGH